MNTVNRTILFDNSKRNSSGASAIRMVAEVRNDGGGYQVNLPARDALEIDWVSKAFASIFSRQ